MKRTICLLVFSLCVLTFSGIAQRKTKSAKTHRSKIVKRKKSAKVEYGSASFYSNKFNGRRTASGEIFSQKRLTAAHNGVPLGTWIKVTNMRNKKTVTVKVTDRLHYRNRRLVDLSRAAAAKLSFSRSGILPVKIEILGKSIPVEKTK